MTTDNVFQFGDTLILGRVTSVDTSRVLVVSENTVLLPRASVGKLLAIQGSSANEYFIATVERVTRQLTEQVEDPDPVNPTVADSTLSTEDVVRAAILGTFKSVDGVNRKVFKRGAGNYPQIDRNVYLIEGGDLQRFMNLLGAGLNESQRMELGTFALDPSAVAIANGDKFFQRHAAILGSTGSGKSYAVSLMLERAATLPHANLIVLDMHGEYSSLSDTAGDIQCDPIAQRYRLAGPGDLDSPEDNCIFLPYWLLNRDEMLSMILDRSDNNAPNQASRFTLHVRDLKEATLISESRPDVASSFTVDSPIPYELGELLEKLKHDDTTKGVGANNRPVKGEWEGKLTRFVSRLEAKIDDRRYGFLFKPPVEALAYDWLAGQLTELLKADESGFGIKIIDFSEVPPDVLPVVTAVFSRLLYDIQFWMEPGKRTPFVFVCDEAHLYLPVRESADAVEKQSLYAFERIAKEGRKYGVSLLVVSQRPSDVSRTILSQCNNFMILRLTNDRDQNVIRRLMPDSLVTILDSLPLLDVGEAYLIGDSILLPSRIKLNKPKIPPLSQTRDFWQEWSECEPDTVAIASAVESLRKQSRS